MRQTVENTEVGMYVPELFRLQGEVLATVGPAKFTEAESCYQRALALAQKQHAKALELLAAMSLCRLYRGRDEEENALAALSQIYNSFTEGFDTKDLRAAKALMDDIP